MYGKLLLATASVFLAVTLRAAETPAERIEAIGKEVGKARHDYNDALLEVLQKDLQKIRKDVPRNYRLQRLIAETYLFRANMLRVDRATRKLDSRTVSRHRKNQAKWGKAGLEYAESAVELAKTTLERVHAKRITGELYVHQISGPVSGLINGPKALRYVREALDEAPDDPECNRAIGLMYLYNPPFNGGDVPRAVKTFRDCTRKVPDSDEYYLYLAFAFRKKGNHIRAEISAKKALKLNTKNFCARNLIKELGATRRKK